MAWLRSWSYHMRSSVYKRYRSREIKVDRKTKRGPYSLYTQASFLARQRLQIGCSPPHLTFRRRHGSHEKALFLVARAELVVVVVLVLLPLPLFPDPFEVDLGADAILTHCPE